MRMDYDRVFWEAMKGVDQAVDGRGGNSLLRSKAAQRCCAFGAERRAPHLCAFCGQVLQISYALLRTVTRLFS